MSNNTDVTFKEYLDFRHKLAEQEYDTEWIGLFVEKLYMDYHAAYMQGRADGMERVLYLQRDLREEKNNDYKKSNTHK